jgi:hypothetical protein
MPPDPIGLGERRGLIFVVRIIPSLYEKLDINKSGSPIILLVLFLCAFFASGKEGTLK